MSIWDKLSRKESPKSGKDSHIHYEKIYEQQIKYDEMSELYKWKNILREKEHKKNPDLDYEYKNLRSIMRDQDNKIKKLELEVSKYKKYYDAFIKFKKLYRRIPLIRTMTKQLKLMLKMVNE